MQIKYPLSATRVQESQAWKSREKVLNFTTENIKMNISMYVHVLCTLY